MDYARVESEHMFDYDFLLRHLIFFMVGIVQDLLITYYYQCITKEHAWKASFLSSTITLVNLLILYKILTGIEDEIMSIILIYALGNGVGTMIVMRKQRLKELLKRIRARVI